MIDKMTAYGQTSAFLSPVVVANVVQAEVWFKITQTIDTMQGWESIHKNLPGRPFIKTLDRSHVAWFVKFEKKDGPVVYSANTFDSRLRGD